MGVFHRQQFLISFGEPLIANARLALRTMAGAAGVERDDVVAALATTIPMATEHRRTAVLDGEKDADLQPC
jgi:hypothetical protein